MTKRNKVRHRIRYGQITGTVRSGPVRVEFACSCGQYEDVVTARLEAGCRVIAESRVVQHAYAVRAAARLA